MMDGRRFFFPWDLAGFLAAENPLSLICGDGPGGGPEELALLGLRLCQGIDRKEAAAAYPDHDWDGLWQKSRPMIGAEMCIRDRLWQYRLFICRKRNG